ncbi:kynureninase-like isoform X2 [Liolophura sinensis]|uniref:kynureninase-like isoform X2 n=1 Tax=Liolophura sinensis TaxID=3198878 RepID=UPI003158F4F8
MGDEPNHHISSKKMLDASHPWQQLQDVADSLGCDITNKKFAQYMDQIDPIGHLRGEFFYPKMKELPVVDQSLVDPEEDCVYFCGNSLGLCPRATKKYMDREITKWAQMGVIGHFSGESPWSLCDEKLDEVMGKLVGAKPGEVAIMNGLTVNLHLLLISFYRPTPQRHKILLESKAFPSDVYAVESQIRLHGYDPDTSVIALEPREGEFTLRTEDILSKIEEEGDSIAVVMFSGVQYYTGQVFEMERICKAGHKKGCYVGFDLAHAAGNVPVCLHDWDIDFACWCTYKYLNSSAGCLAGFFLHEKFARNDFPKLLGWWGHELSTRFTMDNKMVLSPGAYGYRITNPAGLLCPPIEASLEVFKKTSMSQIRTKSKLLTGYLELLIVQKYHGKETGQRPHVDIMTPSDPEQRGAQLSLIFSIPIIEVFKELEKRGVVCDKREPSVIRIAPAPLYCSFYDVHRFMKYLEDALQAAYAAE